MWTLVLAALVSLVVVLVTMAVNVVAAGFILGWFPVWRRKWIYVVFSLVCVAVAIYWSMMLWLGITAFGVAIKPLDRILC